MFKNLQIRRYHKQLTEKHRLIGQEVQERFDTAAARRVGVRELEKSRSIDDFMTEPEKREFDILVDEHNNLSHELGLGMSEWWSPKKASRTSRPNSPDAFLTVTRVENKPVEVSLKNPYTGEIHENTVKQWTLDPETEEAYRVWLYEKHPWMKLPRGSWERAKAWEEYKAVRRPKSDEES